MAEVAVAVYLSRVADDIRCRQCNVVGAGIDAGRAWEKMILSGYEHVVADQPWCSAAVEGALVGKERVLDNIAFSPMGRAQFIDNDLDVFSRKLIILVTKIINIHRVQAWRVNRIQKSATMRFE